ncbi:MULTISPECIES: hypothetical protein [Limnospira]|uniref:hypothetical protein n=1 Tax=Limnospira TaxID=2596745 RepID=UPI0002803D6A|nr:hypothetical protein SPLC1_S532990 [Arthrospira platensis C1]MDY7054960.1 hypothetical protein [Limnospira fusiformis LS22]UWU48718.1 hypothetical protein APLC1_3520 [Arthrospira platensis C1]
MSIFYRKIYALLGNSDLCNHLVCLQTEEAQTALSWWLTHQGEIEAIATRRYTYFFLATVWGKTWGTSRRR